MTSLFDLYMDDTFNKPAVRCSIEDLYSHTRDELLKPVLYLRTENFLLGLNTQGECRKESQTRCGEQWDMGFGQTVRYKPNESTLFYRLSAPTNCLSVTTLYKGQIILKGLLVSSNSPKKWTNKFVFKVHIFWEGHKILRNLPLTFDYSTYSQK